MYRCSLSRHCFFLVSRVNVDNPFFPLYFILLSLKNVVVIVTVLNITCPKYHYFTHTLNTNFIEKRKFRRGGYFARTLETRNGIMSACLRRDSVPVIFSNVINIYIIIYILYIYVRRLKGSFLKFLEISSQQVSRHTCSYRPRRDAAHAATLRTPRGPVWPPRV